MKKIVLVAAALALSATAALAATTGVTNTKHDLSATASLTGGTGADQKCIYCHTPHNTRVAVPLWNRNAGSAISPVYNSATLTTAAKNAAVSSDTISGFCMSCHDGVTSMGAIKNKAGGTDAVKALPALTGYNAKNNLGTDLSNDHPVGFNYNTAQGQETDGGLRDLTTAGGLLGGNAFFGTNAQDMECASCHKVHDNTVTPFLRVSNSGSNLCLACHIK